MLHGSLRARALDRVRAIAARLTGAADTPAPELALRALFLAACDQAFPSRGHRRTADLLLERAVAMVNAEPLLPRLHGGVLTIAWVVEQLARGQDVNRQVDEALADELPVWAGKHDLIFGLTGVGVYALARDRADLVAGTLEQLEANACDAGGGRLAWFTPPEWMLDEQRHSTPAGHYNAGVAHGAAGVAGLAARALERAIDPARAGRLLTGAIGWLDSIALDGDARFPCWVPGERGYRELGPVPRAARSAWCYGDPGIAAQLWAAGRAADQPSWSSRAIELARGALARPGANARIGRHGLCHGAAGFAHMLNRLAQSSGDAALEIGALTWYERAMELPPDNPSFLTGACGIGLALLAAAHDAPPAWDALLLLD